MKNLKDIFNDNNIRLINLYYRYLHIKKTNPSLLKKAEKDLILKYTADCMFILLQQKESVTLSKETTSYIKRFIENKLHTNAEILKENKSFIEDQLKAVDDDKLEINFKINEIDENELKMNIERIEMLIDILHEQVGMVMLFRDYFLK